MKKSLMILTLIAASHANAAALPKILDTAVNAKVRQFSLALPQNKSNPTQCADFRGRWQGTCSFGETSKDLEISIEQKGCHSLEINGEHLAFNQNSASTNSGSSVFGSSHWSNKLSADGQSVQMHGNILIDNPSFPEPVFAQLGGALKRAQDKLIIEGGLELRAGAQNKGDIQVRCEMMKVN